MATIPGDNTFTYVYSVQVVVFYPSGTSYNLGSRLEGFGAGVKVHDVTTRGDTTLLSPKDNFAVTGATDPSLNITYKYSNAAQANGSTGVGFIATGGGQTYFFTDTLIPSDSRTLSVVPDTSFQICFMSGTAISTPAGRSNIETLRIGDVVLTSDGGAAAIRWIGRQTVSTLFADETRLPVRVKAGALGENVPCRDLLVSNDHALLVESVLVQAGALINGITVVRERNVPKIFTYYHVELDDHSLILAENVPAETFVDNVERHAFDNWAEYQALYPAERSVPEMDVPRVKAQRQLPGAVRRLLDSRIVAIEVGSAA